MNLNNRTILITRAAHQSDGFVQRIEQFGGKAVVLPTIEIVPPQTWDACDRAIDALYMYDGIIFTSANGGTFFLQRLQKLGVDFTALAPKMIFVVGEKTREIIVNAGITVTAMPDKFTAADLAKTLEQEDLVGKHFLFPRGNLGSDILQDNLKLLGATVDSIIVYRTVKPKPEHASQLRHNALNGKIDVATFTSPSTFKNFIELFTPAERQELKSNLLIAVIGPVTTKTVQESGFRVHITAQEATIESLVDAITLYYQSSIHNTQSEIHS